MARKSKTSKAPNKPVRSSDVPATPAMLYEMEDRINHRTDSGFHKMRGEMATMKSELKSDIKGLRSEIKSDINELRTEFKSDINELRSEFKADNKGIKSDIVTIKSDITIIKSDISSIKSELHRVALLVEEQNARNKYVMDGYAQIYDLLINRGAGSSV